MTEEIRAGDIAPNFDLASTEGVVLMLRDEFPRHRILLYVFRDLAQASDDLEALGRLAATLISRGVRIMTISDASLLDLADRQRTSGFSFPLLHDDRGFAALYGADGESGRALVMVGRDGRIEAVERGNPVVASLAEEWTARGAKARGPASDYPRSVINRLVQRWGR